MNTFWDGLFYRAKEKSQLIKKKLFEENKKFRELIVSNQTENVTKMIENGVDLNYQVQIYPQMNLLPVVTAARANNVEILKLLFHYGANANPVQKKQGHSIWHDLLSDSTINEPDVIKVLLENGIM